MMMIENHENDDFAFFYSLCLFDISLHIRYHIVYTVYGSTRSTLSFGIAVYLHWFKRYEIHTYYE